MSLNEKFYYKDFSSKNRDGFSSETGEYYLSQEID
jgi:hypothetical protein